MWTTVRYTFLTAIRDWLFIGLFAGMLAAFGIAIFLGSTALVEESQMTITYIGGSTRVILLIGLITFVCFHVRRAFENREVEVILSRPISRTTFVAAYWLGFAVVAMLLILPLLAAMAILLPGISLGGLLYWGFSLMLEAFIVVAFALFCALILRSAVSSVLLCFGFYFISRMMGFFLYVIDAPHLFKSMNLGALMGQSLQFVSAVLPRLDLYSQSKWLVYGAAGDTTYLLFLIQAVIYVPLLLAAALFDFKRKQF
jgi:ABC-type transport system involved in multi-copper enzyme maturation permease subunit